LTSLEFKLPIDRDAMPAPRVTLPTSSITQTHDCM
jgi:hypothetical protein